MGEWAAESSGWRHKSPGQLLQAETENPKSLPGPCLWLLSANPEDREYPRENIPGKGKEEGGGLGSAGRGPISEHQGRWLTIKESLGLKETGHSQATICSHWIDKYLSTP